MIGFHLVYESTLFLSCRFLRSYTLHMNKRAIQKSSSFHMCGNQQFLEGIFHASYLLQIDVSVSSYLFNVVDSQLYSLTSLFADLLPFLQWFQIQSQQYKSLPSEPAHRSKYFNSVYLLNNNWSSDFLYGTFSCNAYSCGISCLIVSLIYFCFIPFFFFP